MRYLFLDIETTGLDSDRDEITEIAWVDGLTDASESYFVQHLQSPNDWVSEHTDYRTRICPAFKCPPVTVLRRLRALCADTQTFLVGANPSFDDRFLRVAFRRYLQSDPPYHFHLIDVEVLAMQAFRLDAPAHLKDLRGLLGLPGANPAPHSALADAIEAQIAFSALRARVS